MLLQIFHDDVIGEAFRQAHGVRASILSDSPTAPEAPGAALSVAAGRYGPVLFELTGDDAGELVEPAPCAPVLARQGTHASDVVARAQCVALGCHEGLMFRMLSK